MRNLLFFKLTTSLGLRRRYISTLAFKELIFGFNAGKADEHDRCVGNCTWSTRDQHDVDVTRVEGDGNVPQRLA